MDEVYNDLLQYEVALEEKNAALEESQQFIESVLASMSDILIVCDRHGVIEEVNAGACSGLVRQDRTSGAGGTPVFDLFADEASREQARDFFAAHRQRGRPRLRAATARRRRSTVPVR
jgi:two-component system sensor histidine kinase HupT/HoxJ